MVVLKTGQNEQFALPLDLPVLLDPRSSLFGGGPGVIANVGLPTVVLGDGLMRLMAFANLTGARHDNAVEVPVVDTVTVLVAIAGVVGNAEDLVALASVELGDLLRRQLAVAVGTVAMEVGFECGGGRIMEGSDDEHLRCVRCDFAAFQHHPLFPLLTSTSSGGEKP